MHADACVMNEPDMVWTVCAVTWPDRMKLKLDLRPHGIIELCDYNGLTTELALLPTLPRFILHLVSAILLIKNTNGGFCIKHHYSAQPKYCISIIRCGEKEPCTYLKSSHKQTEFSSVHIHLGDMCFGRVSDLASCTLFSQDRNPELLAHLLTCFCTLNPGQEQTLENSIRAAWSALM